MKISRDNLNNKNSIKLDPLFLEAAISESGINVPPSPSVNVSENEKQSDVPPYGSGGEIREMNDYFFRQYEIYKNILAPELIKNEELKRSQKKDLMRNIFKLLKWQFIATYILFILFIVIIALNDYCFRINAQVIIEILSFLKFYITSIVVELVSILFFIVKNVFDKSIVDLFKNFDKNKNNVDLHTDKGED